MFTSEAGEALFQVIGLRDRYCNVSPARDVSWSGVSAVYGVEVCAEGSDLHRSGLGAERSNEIVSDLNPGLVDLYLCSIVGIALREQGCVSVPGGLSAGVGRKDGKVVWEGCEGRVRGQVKFRPVG